MIQKFFVCIAIASIAAGSAAGAETSNRSPTEPTEQEILDQFRSDLQTRSADVMAKGLTLSSEQAAKFWPLFEQYQKEQDEIVNGQLKATQTFAENYQKLTDQDALTYVNALLERDQKVHDLRVKWLKKFQTVVPPRIAARAIQLERRMGIVAQIKLSSHIPLVR